MLSATVSLHLVTFCKMLLILGKLEGTLAVCLLVGFHLSPVIDMQGLTLHSHISCCRHHSSPLAHNPLFSFCFCFFTFRLRRSYLRDVCFGKRRKMTTLELLKKNAMQVSTKSRFKES